LGRTGLEEQKKKVGLAVVKNIFGSTVETLRQVEIGYGRAFSEWEAGSGCGSGWLLGVRG